MADPDLNAERDALKSAIADLSLAIMHVSNAVLMSVSTSQSLHMNDLTAAQEALRKTQSFVNDAFHKAEDAFKKAYPGVE